MKILRALLKAFLSLILIVLLVAVGVVGWLTLTEYKPEDVETLSVNTGARHDTATVGQRYKLVTLNVGYGGLGRDEDFFMDGGKNVGPKNKQEVEDNLSGLLSALSTLWLSRMASARRNAQASKTVTQTPKTAMVEATSAEGF